MRALHRATGRPGRPVTHVTDHWVEVDHPEADRVLDVADAYLDAVVDAIVNQPRSLQAAIGPSEIGADCATTLLHKLNGDPEPARDRVPWKPTIGTATHAYLEEAFDRWGRTGRDPLRFLTERKVVVGEVAGLTIAGSTDLFDLWTQAVIDHKVIGPKQLAKYRAHGPTRTYRVQAHAYGKGWEDAGIRPNLVVIAFLARDGDLEDTYFWAEPYDRQIALDALARLEALELERLALGIDAALAAHAGEKCGEPFCAWHRTGWQNRGVNPRPDTTTVDGLLALGP